MIFTLCSSCHKPTDRGTMRALSPRSIGMARREVCPACYAKVAEIRARSRAEAVRAMRA